MRKLAIVLGIAIVAIVAVLFALPMFIPAETVRKELAAQLSQAAGRPVTIDGDVSISVLPTVRFSARGIEIPGMGGGENAFSLESVSFGLSPFALIGGKVVLDGVTLGGPKVLVEVAPDGSTNWTPHSTAAATPAAAPAASPGATAGAPAASGDQVGTLIGETADEPPAPAESPLAILDRLRLGTIRIVDGTLIYRDRASGRESRLDAVNLDLDVPGSSGLLDARGSFDWQGLATKLELGAGRPADPAKIAAIPVQLHLTSDAFDIAAKGTALPVGGSFDGTLTANGSSLAAIADRLGVALPAGKAFAERYSAEVTAKVAPTTIDVPRFAVTATGLDASGGAKVVLGGARPALGLRLAIAKLDLDALRGPAGAQPAKSAATNAAKTAPAASAPAAADAGGAKLPKAKPGAAAPAAPAVAAGDAIDFSPLGLVDANVALTAKSISAGPATITDLATDITLADRVLQASVKRLAMAGASASGAITVDARQPAAAMAGSVKASGIDLAKMAALAGVSQPLAGRAGLDISFTTRGATVAAIAGALDGKGSLSLADGSVGGLGLASSFGGDKSADQITDIALTAQFASLANPVALNGGLTWRGERFTLSGSVAPRALIAGTAGAVAIKASSSRVTFGFDGSASPKGIGSGRVQVATPSLRNLLAWIGRPLSGGGGLQQFSFDGPVTLAADSVAFDKANIVLDGSRGVATGKVAYGGAKPSINAGLALSVLDLRPYLQSAGVAPAKPGAPAAVGQPAAAPAPAPAAGGWSTSPLGFDGLKAADAALNVRADQILLDSLKIGQTTLAATLKDGVLKANLSPMTLYGGSGTGALTINGAAAVPTVDASFALKNLAARAFLTDAIGFTRIEGTAALDFAVSTSGKSELDLVSRLGGKGSIGFTNGAILGIDIPQIVTALNNGILEGWQAGTGKTAFSALTGTFTIANGILTNSDLAMAGPLFRLTGAGRVDLPRRTLSYRVDPKVVASLETQDAQGANLAGFNVPVIIEGPWAKPRIYPDIKGILQDPAGALKQLKALGGGLSKLGKPGAAAQGGAAAAPGNAPLVDQNGKINKQRAVEEAIKLLGGKTQPTQPAQPQATQPQAQQPQQAAPSTADQATQLLNQLLRN
ncbi:AsmA family protein [Segnochrobactrum spirostomi]|uniref:AsmA family protein n=1 Tax=Segnochrobactrum spirostomi TaxID=2608987 RepID=A0A6A7Y3A0_9HYPH|nr:AsmA family protein [Segnochrobactrum spirostomi]MQT13236.1 AsmA family protein [Segnochrobactrum spirostomi]